MKKTISIEFRSDKNRRMEKYEFNELYKYSSLIGKLCKDEMLEDFNLLIDYSEVTLALLKNEISAQWLVINEYEGYFKEIVDLLLANSIKNKKLHKEISLIRWMLREYQKDYKYFRLTQVL